jgi:hypothetical protein
MPSKLLRISSHDKINGSDSNTDFTVSLQNSDIAKDIVGISLVSLSFTNAAYNVDTSNNTFKFRVASVGTDATVSVPIGQYTTLQLMTQLQTELNSYHLTNLTSETVTITQDPITNKITINSTPGVDLTTYYNLADGNAMATLLGIGTTSPATSSFTFSDLPDLVGLRVVSLHSRSLANSNMVDAQGLVVNSLATIHVDTPFGSNQVYYSQDLNIDQNLFSRSGRNLTTIDIRLRNPLRDGAIVDLHGHELCAVFRIYYP